MIEKRGLQLPGAVGRSQAVGQGAARGGGCCSPAHAGPAVKGKPREHSQCHLMIRPLSTCESHLLTALMELFGVLWSEIVVKI